MEHILHYICPNFIQKEGKRKFFFYCLQERLNMIEKKYVLLVWICCMSTALLAQPALPDFNIMKGPKQQTVLSWKNNFGERLKVLNIQRSTDSVKGFRTIYSVNNLTLAANAYTDNKPATGADYYRLYYMLTNGSYYFTKAKKIATGFVPDNLLGQLNNSKMITVAGANPRKLEFRQLQHLRDSVINNTSDSLYFVNDSTIQYVKYNAVAAMANSTTELRPVSKFLYLNADGYIVLKFPERDLSDYSMTIYKQNGTSVLFKIPRFEDSELILSKSSFLHTGWYPYEIYKDGKLLERSRLEIN